MTVQSTSNSYSPVYSLDQILQDTPELHPEQIIDVDELYQSYKETLNQELITTNREEIEFHAGFCLKSGHAGKRLLYKIVKSSVDNPENGIAAANAITILKTMKVSFSCLDLRGIQISGADLSNAILDNADLSGANLEKVNLSSSSLNNVNMSNATLRSIEIGIPNTLTHEHDVWFKLSSLDNKYLISEDKKYIYFWNISDGTCINKIPSPPSKPHKECMLFFPGGEFLLMYDRVKKIDIWSLKTFTIVNSLDIASYESEYIRFSSSSDGNYLVTYRIDDDKFNIWSIHKSINNTLEIKLINNVDVSSNIYGIQLSKTFPLVYCLKSIDDKINKNFPIVLSIFDIEQP